MRQIAMGMNNESKIVPALGLAWLTPLYDFVVAATMREGTFGPALVDQAAILPGHDVLDLACGTSTLATMSGTSVSGNPPLSKRPGKTWDELTATHHPVMKTTRLCSPTYRSRALSRGTVTYAWQLVIPDEGAIFDKHVFINAKYHRGTDGQTATRTTRVRACDPGAGLGSVLAQHGIVSVLRGGCCSIWRPLRERFAIHACCAVGAPHRRNAFRAPAPWHRFALRPRPWRRTNKSRGERSTDNRALPPGVVRGRHAPGARSDSNTLLRKPRTA